MDSEFTIVNFSNKNYKIKKNKLYKLVYNNEKINIVHDLNQIKLDINRNPDF